MRIRGRETFWIYFDNCIAYDKKDNFVKLFKTCKPVLTEFLTQQIVQSGARDCTKAFLSGEVTDQPPNISDSLTLMMGVQAFADDFEIIELLMTNGGPFYVKSNPDKLPLPSLLTHLTCRLKPLSIWSTGKSLIKLIILLCEPKLNPILKSARALVQHTDTLNEFPWTYAKAGNIIWLATLLLVAPEKTMASVVDGMTIKDRVAHEVSLLTNATNNDPREERRKFHLVESLKVLDLFDKAGNSLSLYHESLPKRVPIVKVVEDVADILKKAHIPLTYDDLDLSAFFNDNAQLKKLPISQLMDGHGNLDNDQSTFSPGAQCTITPSHISTHKRNVPSLVACSTPTTTSHVRKFSASRTGESLSNHNVINPALMTSIRGFSTHQKHYCGDYLLEKYLARVPSKSGGPSCNIQTSQIKKLVYETSQVPLFRCLTFMGVKCKKGIRFL